MNRIQFRNHNAVPLTPNIEEYKQKNKSKSKRKNGTTQPTNPPTPKLVKSNIQQKIIVDRHHPISALQESIQQIPFCVNHPDRKASTSTDESLNRKYCSKCLQNNEQFSLDEEKRYKKRGLEEFREKIERFGQSLSQVQKSLYSSIEGQQYKFHTNKCYITQSFENMRRLLDQKERELINMLYASQQSLKRISKQNLDLIAEINRSLNRYLVDIKRNYDDIISELNIEQYQEIMEQYSRKVNYYYDHVEKICCGDPPNVFIPLRDFEKTLCRASVESYQHSEGANFFTSSLERKQADKHERKHMDRSEKNYRTLKDNKLKDFCDKAKQFNETSQQWAFGKQNLNGNHDSHNFF